MRAIPGVDNDLAAFLEEHRPMAQSEEDGRAPQIHAAWPGSGRTFADIANRVCELARTYRLSVAEMLTHVGISGTDHRFPDYNAWLVSRKAAEIV